MSHRAGTDALYMCNDPGGLHRHPLTHHWSAGRRRMARRARRRACEIAGRRSACPSRPVARAPRSLPYLPTVGKGLEDSANHLVLFDRPNVLRCGARSRTCSAELERTHRICLCVGVEVVPLNVRVFAADRSAARGILPPFALKAGDLKLAVGEVAEVAVLVR